MQVALNRGLELLVFVGPRPELRAETFGLGVEIGDLARVLVAQEIEFVSQPLARDGGGGAQPLFLGRRGVGDAGGFADNLLEGPDGGVLPQERRALGERVGGQKVVDGGDPLATGDGVGLNGGEVIAERIDLGLKRANPPRGGGKVARLTGDESVGGGGADRRGIRPRTTRAQTDHEQHAGDEGGGPDPRSMALEPRHSHTPEFLKGMRLRRGGTNR